MKERPILFSGPMVKAILEGRKTQTRRVVKPQPTEQVYQVFNSADFAPRDRLDNDAPDFDRIVHCPYGAPGDRLWVRETWQINHVMYDSGSIPKQHPVEYGEPVDMLYRADGEFADQFEIDEGGSVWRPSIFMPRWASRLTLEITDVRVERVQKISDADIRAEGFPDDPPSYADGFAGMWNEINAKRGYSWESNPWVWVVEFKKL